MLNVHCPVADFCCVCVLAIDCTLSFTFSHPATDLHSENTHKAYLPMCSVADFDYAPLASHLSRIYPNMKINSQLNATICSPRGRGKGEIKHRFTQVNSPSIKEPKGRQRMQCSLMCKANKTLLPHPSPHNTCMQTWIHAHAMVVWEEGRAI